VTAWYSVQLHDSLVRAKSIRAVPGERDLLWAAAMAHDVGMAVAYDGRAAHAHYVVLNADLPGFTPRELALLAQVVRYHRKGNPSLDELRPLAAKGDEKLVARCAMLLRIAAQLDRGEDGQVVGAAFAAAGRVLRLDLDGDDGLASWRLARHVGDDQFRRIFRRRLEVSAPGAL
jgi:exopolyphosphatase/guanosine-5'-triphosphate,3'-diphosphate pyrophosphatase